MKLVGDDGNNTANNWIPLFLQIPCFEEFGIVRIDLRYLTVPYLNPSH